MFYLNARQIWKFKTIPVISNNLWKPGCSWCRIDKKKSPKPTDLLLLQEDVGFGQILHVLISTLQLLLEVAEPLPHVTETLVKQLRAVGIEQQPSLLLCGGFQFVPQLVEFGQTVFDNGLELRFGLHQVGTLLCRHTPRTGHFTSVAKYKKLNVDIKLLTV